MQLPVRIVDVHLAAHRVVGTDGAQLGIDIRFGDVVDVAVPVHVHAVIDVVPEVHLHRVIDEQGIRPRGRERKRLPRAVETQDFHPAFPNFQR